jgi:addiction module RelB/DinJ family antitoxin
MKTVLNIKVDGDEKEQAKHIAAQMGLPLSTIITAHLREFIRTREFSVSLDSVIKPEIEKELLKRSKQYHSNKHTVYRADSTAKARKVL